ncbi:MAG: hypothetical protein WAU78_14370 [Roseiarcus sp.]
MIQWLADHTSAKGKQLLELLVDRQLFRRLLVVSKLKSPTLWAKLTKFRKDYGEAGVVELQIELQRRIVDFLRTAAPEDMVFPDSEAVTSTEIDMIVAKHQDGDILILVDTPIEKRGSSVPLEYLPEANRRDMLNQWSEPTMLEDSIIWQTVHENFLESVGKMRVFCHPRFRKTIEAGIPTRDLQDMLESAIVGLSR